MKNFTSINDVKKPLDLIQQVVELKSKPGFSNIGKNKTLALIFFNHSLRTRLSTEKAAANLGMHVVVMNVSQDSWNIEFKDGTVMDGAGQEHIKDAARIISGYCDIMGVRSFAELQNKKKDYDESVLNSFLQYATVPLISLESAVLHPLQSLTDMATIAGSGIKKPRVVLSWAPHPKPLPQAVANSFLQWITRTDADLVLTHPGGYELNEEFTRDVSITDQQEKAFANADFIYAKNWSSYSQYGETPEVNEDWTITSEKMGLTNGAKFMHCLPIRRNVVATDDVIDSSLVYEQAKNREYAAQVVLQNILEEL